MKKPKVNVVILVLTQEQVQRIGDGLGEIPTKHGSPIINEINGQLEQVEKDPATFVAMIEKLLAPVKAKLAVSGEPPGN